MHSPAFGNGSCPTTESRRPVRQAAKQARLNADAGRCTQNTRMGQSPARSRSRLRLAAPQPGEPRQCGSPCPIRVFCVHLPASALRPSCFDARRTLLRRTPDRARKPGYHAPIRPPAAAGSSSRPEADIIACCQNPMHQFAPPAAAGPFEQTGSRHHHVLPEPHAPIRAACAARQQPGQGNTPRPAGSCPIRAAHRLAPERT